MKVSIGSDHAGFDLKEKVKVHLEEEGHTVTDKGTYSADSTDYPDYAHAVASEVESGAVEFGILICGSGNGIAMAANKHEGIRCAVCWNREIGELARSHNNANIAALPARFVTDREGLDIVDAFLSVEFEGGRHQRRVAKIPCA